jgi:alpha-1,6-mannosyltransferase
MTKMKVCDLALFSPETSSGVKTYITSKIAYARRRESIEHVVIVPGRTASVRVEGRSKIVTVRGVSTFYPGIRIAANLWKVAAIVEQEQPDIIELNCQYTLPWAAFLATRRSRAPVVGVYHTDVPACVRHMTRGAGTAIAAAAERLTEFYIGLIYRHYTMTIFGNPGLEPRLERLGVERRCFVPRGVDAATFSPARRDPTWRTGLGIGPASKVLVYAGRLSVEKELDVLFDAFGQLSPREFALVIAGDGPGAAATARYAASQPGVHYIGHVESRAQLAAIYASSDICVSPGRYENFPMAAIEAVSCGLPVVGIRDSGTATFVPPEIGALAQAGNAGDFADAIKTIAAWPIDDGRDSRHAFAAARYSWDFVLDQYFEVYRRALDEDPDARSPQ